MHAFNSAAIFLPGHPYIESTTVLSDTPNKLVHGPKVMMWYTTFGDEALDRLVYDNKSTQMMEKS